MTFRPLPFFILCRCREERAILHSVRRLFTGPKLPEEPHPWLQWGQWNQFSLVLWCIMEKGKIVRVRDSGREAELDKSNPESCIICVTLSHRINLLTPDISFRITIVLFPKELPHCPHSSSTFCFTLSLEIFSRFTFYIRSPCPQGGSSG